MKRELALQHEFVEFVPDRLTTGTIYISIPFATVAHSCCCGCGKEVVTPLSPTDWKLTFDGETVSLDPSIGNWSFACQSHYWITRNRVMWSGQWSDEQIQAGRTRDAMAKHKHYAGKGTSGDCDRSSNVRIEPQTKLTIWSKFKNYLRGLISG